MYKRQVSIREVHNKIKEELGVDHTIMGEIYWREFFSYILFHFPYSQKKSFRKKFQKIPWAKSEELFKKWCEGKTGFPIVDAGMRQLNKTGFMHNRVRMIVASFLTKDLHMDWKLGEKYFGEKLIDYDPAVNSGNWQWAASTGCDSVPYFRIFNPVLQGEKFDKDGVYTKRFVPELKDLPNKYLHCPWTAPEEVLNAANIYLGKSYPYPIVDLKQSREAALKAFSDMKTND